MTQDNVKKIAMTALERVHKWRRNHPTLVKERARALKSKVLTYYGRGSLACIVCGESRLECLSIDHKGGYGNTQRKGRLRASTSFYRWLERQGYPEGYQTLCMNCQFAKRFRMNEHNKYSYGDKVSIPNQGR